MDDDDDDDDGDKGEGAMVNLTVLWGALQVWVLRVSMTCQV